MTSHTNTFKNDLEHAYMLGYHHAQRGQYANLKAWPGIKRSRAMVACYEEGYRAGLEAKGLRAAA